jgi:hypothetical protein
MNFLTAIGCFGFAIASLLPGRSVSNAGNNTRVVKWLVEKSSTLRVSGSSNINEYNCEINGYYRPDTIYCFNDGRKGVIPLSGCLEVDVFAFNCHNSVVTKDLRKTLNAKQYPYLSIRFLSLDHFPGVQNDIVNAWIEVELAGKRRLFEVPFQFTSHDRKSFLLNGTKAFCFSDFNITPGEKFGGMIKVKNEFSVNFRLEMNAIM